MGKASFVGLLLIAGLSTMLREARGDPLVDRAEAFRAELSRRNMIVGRDPELGSARAIAQMIGRYFYGEFEFKRYGLQEVEDTPEKVKSNAINTFAVSFGGEQESCNGFKDRVACELLQNNCITLGSGIFCDYDHLLFLRQLARASFAYAHMTLATKPDVKIENTRFEPFSFELLIDFANHQAAPKPREPGGSTKELPGSVRGAVGYAQKYKSIVGESMEFTVLGSIIGHEMAHVESNARPIDQRAAETADYVKRQAGEIGIKIYSKEEANEVARKYRDMTCHGTLSQAELAADLRGIEMLSVALSLQYLLREGDADAKADRSIAELWRIKTAAAVIAMAQSLEYRLIVVEQPREAADRVKSEPWAVNWFKNKKYVFENRTMYEYYRKLAYERTKREFASGNPMRGLRHMHPAYRAGLLLEAVGLRALYDERRKLGFEVGFPIRLYGYVHGSLQAVQEFGCYRDSDSANKRAREFLHEITGIRKGEFLVD